MAASDERAELGFVHGVWREGDRMVVSAGAELPDRCVKTDLPADGQWADIRLRWHHPALFLLLILGIVVYFIMAYYMSTSVIVRVGITESVLSTGRWTRNFVSTLVLGGGVLCVAGVVAHDPALLWTAGVLLVLAIPVFLLRPKIIWATRMERGYVWIAGVHPDYLARLPQWKGW
jgi:hypothetical protein